MNPAARNLAAQIASFQHSSVEVVWGAVVSLQTAPASLTCTFDGNTTNVAGVRYVASYTPTANDVVFGLRTPTAHGSDVIILGKLAV